MMEFREHPVQWTDDKITRFWKFEAASSAAEANYFTNQVGAAVVDYVANYISLAGDVLDYGAGKGYLIPHLLRAGAGTVTAVEYSEESARFLTRRFEAEDRFSGCTIVAGFPVSLESTSFDVIFLVETIEHLGEDMQRATLQEIHRLLRPGGYLVVTTPNDEDLAARTVLCPDCGACFHRMQHVASFTAESLSDVLAQNGFPVRRCEAVHFGEILHRKKLKNRIRRILGRRGSDRPHLACIAAKEVLDGSA